MWVGGWVGGGVWVRVALGHRAMSCSKARSSQDTPAIRVLFLVYSSS